MRELAGGGFVTVGIGECLVLGAVHIWEEMYRRGKCQTSDVNFFFEAQDGFNGNFTSKAL